MYVDITLYRFKEDFILFEYDINNILASLNNLLNLNQTFFKCRKNEINDLRKERETKSSKFDRAKNCSRFLEKSSLRSF